MSAGTMMTKRQYRLMGEKIRKRWGRRVEKNPNAQVPQEYLDCFALKDGECEALTYTWCKYEPCTFYKGARKCSCTHTAAIFILS